MFDSREAMRSYDLCPNRKTSESLVIDRTTPESFSFERRITLVTCPKYPEGEVFMKAPPESRAYNNDSYRNQAAKRIGCIGCKFSDVEYETIEQSELLGRLHPLISEACSALYSSEHYPEAAIRGFKAVKDRLREITGYESSSEAFGKGGLYINGSAGDHVDSMFQQAAKFLMMSIDSFRNEGSHTTYGNVTGSQRAYEYLVLSSLAMNLLDSAATEDETSSDS